MGAILTLYNEQGEAFEIPALRGPVGTLENHTVYRSRSYSIPLAAWVGNAGSYTYEVTDDTITPQTIFLPSDEEALMSQITDGSKLSWSRSAGKITFTATALPPGTLTINGLLIESSATPFDMQTLLDLVYPIGCYYITDKDGEADRPAYKFGGTWERIEGRTLVGAGTGTDSQPTPETRTFVAGETGGEYNHGLTEQEGPEHRHAMKLTEEDTPVSGSSGILSWTRASSGSGEQYYEPSCGYSGNGTPHNNMPPYLAVYIWHRIDPQEVA